MLLLAVLVAQQLDLSWPELQGTRTASRSGRGLNFLGLDRVASWGSGWQCEMERGEKGRQFGTI
jgi:hypothetical protein